MTSQSDELTLLMEMIPPPRDPKITDRKKVEHEIWEKLHVELPPDFYELTATYGGGSFWVPRYSGIVDVFTPYSQHYFHEVEQMLGINREHKKIEGDSYIPFALHPEKPGLLPWGIGSNRRAFYWLTSGTPDEWQIVIQNPEHEFHTKDMTMTSFLRRLFSGEIDFFGGTFSSQWFAENKSSFKFVPTKRK